MVEIMGRLHRETLPSVITPMDMLHNAVTQGANMDVLEKLMALHERYEASLARKAFDAAMAEAKSHMGTVHKTTKGNYGMYADFASVARTVDPILSEHGLCYTFKISQDDKICVTCVVKHRDGHFEETSLMSPVDTSGSKNAVQQIGSTVEYLRRYTLLAALGLAASKDDDGHAAGVKTTTGQSNEIVKIEGRQIAAEEGMAALGIWWTKSLTERQRKDLGTATLIELKAIAAGGSDA